MNQIMDTLEVDESVDFDFFETPRTPIKDAKNNGIGKTSLSKPPAHPRTNSDSPKNSSKIGDPLKLEKSIAGTSSSGPTADYYDDSKSDDSHSPNRDGDRSRDSVSSKSSVTISSRSSSPSSSPGRNNSKPLKNQERIRKMSSNSSFSSDDSSIYERPSNPIAKSKSKKIQSRGNSRHLSDEEEKAEGRTGKTSSLCNDDGDNKKLQYKNKSQAWGKKSSSEYSLKKNRNLERPKTAKNRLRDKTDKSKPKKSDSLSDTLSDSDITDVSPMDSPRNLREARVRDRSKGPRITAAGDGHTQFRPMPVIELDLRDLDRDTDFDRNTDLDSFDLHILMKAVGELEKQKRLKANSRRVMFAPTSLHRAEKANYTFDDNKTRDIERENNRLLKEIVRHVNTGGEHRRGHIRGSATHKLTASAVNRERDIRRIESENLAFLKRLKKVKPTKAISRENQLKEYQSTMLHGVPIASLHPMTRSGHRSGFDDSASSMSSIHSAVSSVRSVNSRYSSRPGSAVRRPSSATRYVSKRPEWSDRW